MKLSLNLDIPLTELLASLMAKHSDSDLADSHLRFGTLLLTAFRPFLAVWLGDVLEVCSKTCLYLTSFSIFSSWMVKPIHVHHVVSGL